MSEDELRDPNNPIDIDVIENQVKEGKENPETNAFMDAFLAQQEKESQVVIDNLGRDFFGEDRDWTFDDLVKAEKKTLEESQLNVKARAENEINFALTSQQAAYMARRNSPHYAEAIQGLNLGFALMDRVLKSNKNLVGSDLLAGDFSRAGDFEVHYEGSALEAARRIILHPAYELPITGGESGIIGMRGVWSDYDDREIREKRQQEIQQKLDPSKSWIENLPERQRLEEEQIFDVETLKPEEWDERVSYEAECLKAFLTESAKMAVERAADQTYLKANIRRSGEFIHSNQEIETTRAAEVPIRQIAEVIAKAPDLPSVLPMLKLELGLELDYEQLLDLLHPSNTEKY